MVLSEKLNDEPSDQTSDQISDQGSTRRSFLAVSAASTFLAALSSCMTHYFDVRGQLKGRTVTRSYTLEKRVREGGIKGPSKKKFHRYEWGAAREQELIFLSQFATKERVFFHSLPDDVLTELTTFHDGKEAVRTPPLEFDLFSGQHGTTKPKRLVEYVVHPAFGEKGVYVRLPDAKDFIRHAAYAKMFEQDGIKFESRYVGPTGVIAYAPSKRLQRKILAAEFPEKVKELAFYIATKKMYEAEYYPFKKLVPILREALILKDLNPNSIKLAYTPSLVRYTQK